MKRYLIPAVIVLATTVGFREAGTQTGVLSPVEAINELMSIPWQGQAAQRKRDAERSIIESLEGRKILNGDGSENGAKWNLNVKLKNVKPRIDLSSPPAFDRASPDGFKLSAPRGSGWSFGFSADVKGNASVKVGGQKIFTWSPSFHFGFQIKNLKIVTEASLDRTQPNRPRLISATVRPSLTVAGGGFLPVSLPISTTFQAEGETLVLRSHLTGIDLKEALSGFNAKLEGDLVISLLPRGFVDVITTEPLPADVDFDEAKLKGDYRTLKIEFHGRVTASLKRVASIKIPFTGFDLSLPFPSPESLDEALAPLANGLPQRWGENKNAPAGTVPDPATLAAAVEEIETGAAKHMPHGAVLSFDFRQGRGGDPLGAYTYGRDEDSTLWTGYYLAAESLRYSVTKSPQSLARVKTTLEGLRRLFWVTSDAVEVIRDGKKVRSPVGGGGRRAASGRSGLLARTAKPVSDPIAYTTESDRAKSGPLELRPCHYMKPEGGWRAGERVYPTLGDVPDDSIGKATPVGTVWYGWGCGKNMPVSRDQYVGVMMGLGLAWELVPDPEVRAVAGRLVDDALTYLLGNRWNVRLPPDNRIETSFFGDTAKQLSFLRIGKTVNPAKYGADYDKFARGAELAWIPIWLSSFDPVFQYYKFNLSHAAFLPTFLLEPGPTQRARWHDSYQYLWGPLARHRNAYFDLARILAEPEANRAAAMLFPSESNLSVRLGDEVKIVLGEWVRRWQLVKGKWGPLNRVGDATPQLRLWPNDFGKYQAVDKVYCLAHYALPVDGRRGKNSEFMWEHSPFRMSVGAQRCSGLRPSPDQILGLDSKQASREGAGVDYLIAYWLARYLGVLP